MSFKLYTYPNSYRANKALVAAQYAGVNIEVPKFEMGKDNKTPAFLKMNPNGKVPTLETPQGGIFESNAIARYVARLRPDAGLYGNNYYQSGLIDSWIDFSTTELEPARNAWMYPIYKVIAFNPKAYEAAKADLNKAFTLLNNYLLNNTYLVGNQVTLADIVIASALYELFSTVLVAEFYAPYGNLMRWFNTVSNQPQFVKVFGQAVFTKEEKLAEGQKKVEKKEAPKKEEKPAPKKEDDTAALEAAAAAEAKAKKTSALDALPPSPMSLDALKRSVFSQRPVNVSFFDEMWATFDYEGWSFWTADYKYNDENKVQFMTSNLVSGFIQRSDSCRKIAMGVMNLNGEEDKAPFTVSGCWLFRGQAVPEEMLSENPDSEYYTWNKIDCSTDAGKALVKEFYTADVVRGETVLERKFFK